MEIQKSKYNSLSEWRISSEKAYRSAVKLNLIYEICQTFGWEKRKPNGYWTKERCIEDAKKYDNPTTWNAHSSAARDASHSNGWYDECCVHMFKKREANGFWTIEKCLLESKKYNSRKEWRGNNRASWSAAKRLGIYEKCTNHMEIIKSWKK